MLDSRSGAARGPPLELSPSSECWSFVSTRTRLAVAPPPLAREGAARASGFTSPGVLPPSNASTPGAPSRHDGSLRRGGRGSPDPRRCRPQGSCPSRRFWLRSRCARTLARSAALRDAPTLRGLVPCRSRPWETPSRAFPSRGAVPALAGLVLPCGFVVDRRRCDALGSFATAFPTALALCPLVRPGVWQATAEP